MHPHAKPISHKMHHFAEHIHNGTVTVTVTVTPAAVDVKEQPADIVIILFAKDIYQVIICPKKFVTGFWLMVWRFSDNLCP